jgi:triacylglycerol lipase
MRLAASLLALVGVAAGVGGGVVGVAPAGAQPAAVVARPAAVPIREPVVLVPGWFGWADSMHLLAVVFRNAGYPTYVLDQNKGFLFDLVALPSTDTSENGPRLAALVDRARAETGAARVNLVGYSYGGVVARHYVKGMGEAAKVRRYVGIGVPQRGIEAACGLPYQETGHLCPGSSFMRTLNAGDDTPDGVTYANIWSDEDGLANVVVDGPVCVRHVPGVAHLGEPFSLAVAAEALARVDGVACPEADRFSGTVPDAQGP